MFSALSSRYVGSLEQFITRKILFLKNKKEFPLWHSGLRILHCHRCCTVGSCGSDWIPDLGTSICSGWGQNRKQKTKQNTKKEPTDMTK